MIYLDNAATSWPKPEQVYRTVDKVLRERGGNSGRGNHKLSRSADEILYEARMLCARLFNARKPENICFTFNATAALNLAMKGVLKPGDHVITSTMEHNAVTRPLNQLEKRGIGVTKVETSPETGVDLNALETAFQKNTKLLVCNHISNVTGAINPIQEIGAICNEKGVLFILDAAQSAGMREIDVEKMNIDLLAFPGHKGLMGPQGTGGLYIKGGLTLETIYEGGTGNQSESLEQPDSGPERYESGTINLPGIAGLAAGIRFVMEQGIDHIENRELQLTNLLISGLEKIQGINIYGPKSGMKRGSVVSITIDGLEPIDAALILDNAFEIAVRAGLHCASDAHNTIGTIGKGGTLRLSPGFFTTENEIDSCIEALKDITR